jgi:hypothetical protein
MDGAASEAGQSQRHEAQKPQHRPVGGPVPRPWREGTLTRARELQALWTWVVCKDPPEHYEDLAEGILEHLEAAREAAEGKRLHPKRQGSGVLVVARCCLDGWLVAVSQPTGAAGVGATWQPCWVVSSWVVTGPWRVMLASDGRDVGGWLPDAPPAKVEG